MQLNETDRMALEFNRQARKLLGNRVTDFVISDVNDDPNHRAFSSTFKAYDFFMVRLNYTNWTENEVNTLVSLI